MQLASPNTVRLCNLVNNIGLAELCLLENNVMTEKPASKNKTHDMFLVESSDGWFDLHDGSTCKVMNASSQQIKYLIKTWNVT